MTDVKKDLRFNGSGAYDPTPFEAIKKETMEERERFRASGKLVKTLQEIAHLAGFEVVGRINLKDKKTGKLYD